MGWYVYVCIYMGKDEYDFEFEFGWEEPDHESAATK
jgi:hypothetical protein